MPFHRAGSRRRARGVTLLELVVVMLLVGVLFAVAMQPIANALRSRQAVADSLAAVDEVRVLAERIVRELRQARSVDGRVELWPRGAAGAGSQGVCIQRVSRADALPPLAVSVVFEYADGALRFAEAEGAHCPGLQAAALPGLALQGLRFTYYGPDAGGRLQVLPVANVAALQAAVRAVEVQVELGDAQGAASQRLLAFLRNGGMP